MVVGQSEPKDDQAAQAYAQSTLVNNPSARLENPLAPYSFEQLQTMGAKYAMEHDLEDHVESFKKGAMLAKDNKGFDSMPLLTDEERNILRREITHRWSHPWPLYNLVITCSIAAAVQGMDESVINGANLYFFKQFGIEHREWIKGLVNAAPYLCCATIGCWLTRPLNQAFGRRHTIFITCLISAITCFWQAFTNSWWHLFIARFFLGFGIGPKSSTVPMYAAECSPPAIRGALVMMWQMWTAFGIMLGYICDVAFMDVKTSAVPDLNWRMMLASAMVPPLIVCVQVYFCPESPRYRMSKQQHRKSFDSLARLRWSPVQAARDQFYMHVLLEAEKEMAHGSALVKEMFTVGRNRRAMQASEIVMFMQQFCGVNIIAYYSSSIFASAGFSHSQALLASMGFGIINFLFALPAVYTIDTFGRRNLLLTTFPLMALALLFTGFCFWIDPDNPSSKARIGCIATGIYLFGVVYSPGEGPVPFTYSAEAYPLYIRDLGMSLATATTWGFNFLLAITWFALEKAFTSQGAFAYYAAWNIFGFFMTLFFVPETKGKTLEELDMVFSVPTRVHAAYGARQIPYFFKRYIFRQDVKPERLYDEDEVSLGHSSSFDGEKEVEAEKRA